MLIRLAKRRSGRTRQADRGFSLIELLIVVAIILIIAAIALPNFMRSRMAANEAAAVTSLRNITTGSTVYFSTYSNGYPPGLPALGGAGMANCDQAILIDSVLALGQKSGYRFTYTGVNRLAIAAPGCAAAGFYSFTVRADPLIPGSTGQRYFFTDQSGVVRFNAAAPAGPGDPPLT